MSDENPTIHRSLSNNPQADLAGGGPHFEPSAERYRVIEEIARGGMGRILKVYDNDLRRYVAMKVVRAPADLDAYQIQKFVEEAQVSAQLQHPCIVPTYEVGTDAGGNLYYTMKLVEGRSLSQVMRAIKDGSESMSELKRLQTLQAVAQALGYAHAKGVVHRDLKPDNIMLGRHGEILVIDWGLARVMGRTPSSTGSIVTTKRSENDSTQTLDGMIAGTPVYMAPEQAEGRMEDIEPRTDVYALGAILYHLLTLQQPVVGRELRELLDNVARGNIREIPKSVPRELAAVIRRAMALEAKDRYPTAEAFADDLQAYIEGRRGEAWSDNPLTLASKWVRRNRALAAVGIAAVLTVGALIAWQRTRPGTIDLDSNPRGAEVWIDGEPAGKTPLIARRVSPGRHEVTLRLDVHHDAVQTIHVGAGAKADYAFNLRPVFGVLSLTSDPIGAEVWIGGEPAGRTPIAETLAAGEHRLRLTLDGHLDHIATVDMRDGGEVTRLHLALDRNVGRLRLAGSPAGAAAEVIREADGTTAARVTIPHDDPLDLEPGRFRVRFELRNHVSAEAPAEVVRDIETRVGRALVPQSLWTTELGAPVRSAPALGDVDGDGWLDVVVAVADGHLCAVSGLNGAVLWKRRVFAALQLPYASTQPILEDVDGDGAADAIVASGARISALSGKSGEPTWTVRFAAVHLRGVDLDADGVLDVVAAGHAECAAFSGRDGTELWQTALQTAGAPLLVDVDGDGVADVVVSLLDRRMTALSGRDGTILWDRPTPRREFVTIAATSGDGLVLAEPPSTLWVVGPDGRPRWGDAEAFRNAVATVTADLDGDGVEDVLSLDTALSAWSGADGDRLWWRELGESGFLSALPGAVVAVTGSRVSAFSAAGEALWRYDLDAQGTGAAAIADLNGDGLLEAIVGTESGRLTAFCPEGTPARVEVPLSEGRTLIAGRDLDGDGTPDWITLGDGVLEAHSGEDGSRLWSVEGASLAAVGEDRVFVFDGDRLTSRAARGAAPLWETPVDVDPVDALLALRGEGVALISAAAVDGRRRMLVSVALFSATEGALVRRIQTSWPIESDNDILTPDPVAADFDGDGTADFALTVGTTRLRAVSGLDGRTVWEVTQPQAGFTSLLATADFDGDGTPDVVTTVGGSLAAHSGRDGAELWRATGLMVIEMRPSVGDFDGDGLPDAAIGGMRAMAVSGRRAERLWLYPRKAAQGFLAEPEVFDIDGDGREDCLFFDAGDRMTAVSGLDGEPIWTSPTGGSFWSRVAAGGRVALLLRGSGLLRTFEVRHARNRYVWHGAVGPDFRGAACATVDWAARLARAERRPSLAAFDEIENQAGDPALRRRAAYLAAVAAASHRATTPSVYAWIDRAIAHGFDDAAVLEADEAFEALRGTARFHALVERLRRD